MAKSCQNRLECGLLYRSLKGEFRWEGLRRLTGKGDGQWLQWSDVVVVKVAVGFPYLSTTFQSVFRQV